MSDETATQGSDGQRPAGRLSEGVKTAIFLAVLAAVVGTFWYLSTLEHPPDLPSDATHKFRFNTAGELVGLAIESPDGAAVVEHSDLELDKKAIETRVNNVCVGCHGAPGQDLTSHPCVQGGRCIPEQHPPKSTCIKCHRHAGQ